MQIINVGETFEQELVAKGVRVAPEMVKRVIEALREHDATKKLIPKASNIQMKAELANRTVKEDSLAVTTYGMTTGMNLYEAVDAFVQGNGTVEQKLRWNVGNFERDHALIAPIAQVFNYTEEELDTLFIEASKR